MIVTVNGTSRRASIDGAADRARPLHRGAGVGQRWPLLVMQMTLALVVAGMVLVIAPRHSDEMNDVVTYAAWGLAMLAGGVAALMHVRFAVARMKLRWMLLGIGLCGGAGGYLIASANNYAAVFHVLDPLLILCPGVGSAALLLSITISFAGAPAGIVIADLVQTVLYVSLSYVVNAGSNPWAKDVQSHVLISLSLNLMLFLAAAVAPLSAATSEERRFFRIAAVYLGASLVARFISSQVGYLWVHAHGNLYCLPAIGVCLAMALFLMQDTWRASKTSALDRELVVRRFFLRNLMPSLLGFMSLVIALYVFLHAPVVGFVAVLAAILLYLSRTLQLQAHMGREAYALRQRNEQLEEISERDPLTGAGNRRSLAARYERILQARPVWITVLLIDLDFFKRANDLLGHLHGDRILQEVAEVLRRACEPIAGSHVARFGGDEFALLLPQVDAVDAGRVAETVRAAVQALRLDAGDCPISVSTGGVATQEPESLDALIRRADVALYQAKIRGRNRVAFDLDDRSSADDTAELAVGSLV